MRISDWSSDVCSSDLSAAPSGRNRCRNSARWRRAPNAEATSATEALRVTRLHMAASPLGRCRSGRAEHFVEILLDRRHDAEAILGERLQHVQRRPRSHQRSEEHTSELQSLMRISYSVFCLKNKQQKSSEN